MDFPLCFGFVPFRPMLGLSWVLGLFVVLWQGCSRLLVDLGVCWVGIVLGLVSVVWVFDGASTVFWVLCGIWVLWILADFLRYVCGLAELFLCILPVYVEAPLVFLIKFSYS
jgi:hypothetical protein